MSRLVIRNLPPTYTSTSELRSHLLQKTGPGGVITDVKVPLSSGRSRQLAFVGYKTAEEAQKAKDWFDKTYVGMSRITIEIADDTRSVSKIKGTNTSKRKGEHQEDGGDKKKRKLEGDERFEEFKTTFASRTNERTWGESGVVQADAAAQQPAEQEIQVDDAVRKEQEQGLSDADWLKRRTEGVSSL